VGIDRILELTVESQSHFNTRWEGMTTTFLGSIPTKCNFPKKSLDTPNP